MRNRLKAGVIHVHSDYSRDGCDSLEQLRSFAVERDLAFIGLTDHAEDFDPNRFAQYLQHCRAISDARLTVIPGLEYRFDRFPGLHLLALDLSRWIVPRTPDEFILETRDAARFTIVAHPMLANYKLPPSVANGIDAVEVWNANYNTRYLPDPRAIRLLRAVRRERPEVVGVVGLDQHDSRNDRQTRVMIDETEVDPMAALKAGRFVNVGRTMSFHPTLEWRPVHLRALVLARWTLDVVERVQSRLARAAK